MKQYEPGDLEHRIESRIAEVRRLLADVRSSAAESAAAKASDAQRFEASVSASAAEAAAREERIVRALAEHEDRITRALEAHEERVTRALAEDARNAAALRDDELAGSREKLAELEARLARIEAGIADLGTRSNASHPIVQGGRNLNATLIDGLLVAVPAEELRLSLYHAFYGFQEPGVLALFAGLLRPGSVVVDVGACIGAFTLYAARAVGRTGKVYAFEPSPRTFDVLVENLKFNGFYDTGVVDARPVAIADHDGTTTLNVFEGDFGLNSLYARPAATTKQVTVDVRRLDEALSNVARVDVIKIDAEGAERAVILGMPRLLEANRDLAIVMEFASTHLRRAGIDPGPFAQELLDRGFTPQLIDDVTGALQPIGVPALLERHSSNILWRRTGSPAS